MRFLKLFLLPALIVVLSACSSTNTKEDDITADWDARRFYEESRGALNEGSFEEAIGLLQKLEARYPFSIYATQAQLDIAYAYYRFNDPDLTIAAADRFIRLHPQDENVAYTIYLKGLADFYRNDAFLDQFIPRDKSQFDSTDLRRALKNFNLVVERYPDSIYATDAQQRAIYLRNQLGLYEIKVARYYVKRGAWLAAAQRAQYTVEYYPNTPASREALQIMAYSYRELGLFELADDAERVLKQNPLSEQASASLELDRVKAAAPFYERIYDGFTDLLPSF